MSISEEERELFKRAIEEGLDLKISKALEGIKDMEIPPISERHKIEMNRLFRELAGK